MRFASACLVSLVVAYTCFGQSDEPAPAAPKTACPLSAGAQSACSKSACPNASACPTAAACPTASACPHCVSSSVTACAQPSACANAACDNAAPCTNIAECATSRVAARVALGKELAACKIRATTDAIARHPELLGINVSVATPACADSAGACAANAKTCDKVACSTNACPTTTLTAATCETAACAPGACQTIASETACSSNACDKSACCQTQGAQNACHKSECGRTAATAVATATDDDGATPGMRKCFELNSREATMVTSAERLDHLQKAAEHLAAAGCENEAACVTAWATEVKHDMVSHLREMSEVLKEAASDLEEELKSEAADKSTGAPATGDPVAAACSTKACQQPACDKTAYDKTEACEKTACKTACPSVAIAAAKSCELPKACDAPRNNCDSQTACGTNVKIVEVCLTDLRNLGKELPGCCTLDTGSPGQACIELVCPEKLQAKLAELERQGLVRVVNVPSFVATSGQAIEMKHPDSGSHICVQTQLLDAGRVKVDITPCEASPPPANPNLARYKRTYEVDAHFEMACGQAAVIGGEVNQRVRVEKRVGLTSATVTQTKSQHQTLFIVTPATGQISAVKQVSHTEPAANDGASVCPTACDKAVLKTAARQSCESSDCQSKSSCPTANCPTTATNCDSAHTPACHAATGVASSTCPLTSDAQLLTACEAAKACAAKTSTCQQKSCDTQTATACSKASACNATATCQAPQTCDKKLACDASAYLPAAQCQTARCESAHCETSKCDKSDACPTAVASGQSLLRPATPFLAEVVATDAPGACASSAAACCQRNKSCTAGACCRQSEAAAMASATDEPCATEACADAPCADAVCTDLHVVGNNSNAGCVGVIACDSGVQSTAMPVATGSYLEMHLSHLTKAAEHLAQAGLAEEAASVSVLANQLRQELIATKHAQIASLKAEIAALRADSDAVCRALSTDSAAAIRVCRPAACVEPECNSPIAVPVLPAPRNKATQAHGAKANKQILLKVKIVEVSMNQLKQLGFEIETASGGAAASGDGFHSFLEALEREDVAKVLAEPSLVLADRRPASYHVGGSVNLPKPGGKPGECISHEIGTRLDAVAVMLDDRRVRIDIRPRVAELETFGDHGPGICVREIDTGFETELGKTVVLGGLLQEQVRMKKDPETLAERPVHDQRQTFFLVTPCAMEVDSAVQPVSHEAPIAR